MRYFLFLLVLVFFLNCKSDNKRSFHFKSVGWHIQVPSDLTTTDSLGWSKRYPSSPGVVMYSERILLRISDSSKFRLGAPYLIASIKPIQPEGQHWNEDLRTMRTEWVDALSKDYLPKATIDSAYSTETIDGKIFDKTYFKVKRELSTQYVYIYSRIINGFAFHCVIDYMATKNGKIFTDLFKESTFDFKT